jgi:prephenate dehydrogenase
VHSVTITGLGLIGGSIGMALRRAGWEVSYVDPAVELDAARGCGAADRRLDSAASQPVDVIVVATPVEIAIEMVRALETTALVTSVCSVMKPLREAAPPPLRFAAGHPLAGSEKRSLAAASPDLFRGKRWFVDEELPDTLLQALIQDCGGVPVPVKCGDHDEAMAVTSHLPQLLSTALAALVESRGVDQFAGSGLATFLRLAGSEAPVWEPVLAANREAVGKALQDVRQIAETLLSGDHPEIFDQARQLLQRLPLV